MPPGFRHLPEIDHDKYAKSIRITVYPSGGTHKAVASAFGVSRSVVKRWIGRCQMNVKSHPETRLAAWMERRLKSDLDKEKLAQWIMDEGSISVAYFSRGD